MAKSEFSKGIDHERARLGEKTFANSDGETPLEKAIIQTNAEELLESAGQDMQTLFDKIKYLEKENRELKGEIARLMGME